MNLIIRSALVITIFLIADVFTFGQEPNHPQGGGTSQDRGHGSHSVETSKEQREKAALSKRFWDNYPSDNAERSKIAYEAAKEYLRRYPNDYVNSSDMGNFVSYYEKEQSREALYARIVENSRGGAEQKKIANDLCGEFGRDIDANKIELRYLTKNLEMIQYVNTWAAEYYYNKGTQERSSLLLTFISLYRGDATQQKLAHDLGKEYLNIFGKDTLPQFADAAKFIQQWMSKYEQAH